MNMEYKLLDNKKGFILTRQPEIVERNLYILFSGAPENATAIFENAKGDFLYRQLQDYNCILPVRFLDGIVNVTVTVLDGSANSPKWHCEEIKVTKIDDRVIVCPNDMNIPQQMLEILFEQQIIIENTKILSDSFSELNNKLNKLLEGYDIT